MAISVLNIFAMMVLFLLCIFFVLPLIGKFMRFVVNNNSEENEYRANLLNAFAVLLFICGILILFYCVGVALSVILF